MLVFAHYHFNKKNVLHMYFFLEDKHNGEPIRHCYLDSSGPLECTGVVSAVVSKLFGLGESGSHLSLR